MNKQGYPIAVAARRSEVSAHTIRAWEKRYRAIVPSRSGTKRRLYTDEDIDRLRLLRNATLAGHTIGNIANLTNEELSPLAAEMEKPEQKGAARSSLDAVLAAAWGAVTAMDSSKLDSLLTEGVIAVGRGALTKEVIVPLINKIGAAWEEGTLRVSHEHMATHVIRNFLGSFVHAHSATSNAPVLVVATPPGQQHELGALIACSIATDHGWRVVYVGASLPPEEIAAAVRQTKADALALSIVYPADDAGLAAQLNLLRKLVPSLPIVVGGRSVHGYRDELRNISATVCNDVPGIVAALEKIRGNRRREIPLTA